MSGELATVGAVCAVGAAPEQSQTETWQDEMREAARSEDFSVVDGDDNLNERIRRKFENPGFVLYQIQDAASKFSFLLAPLSLPFIALLFVWKRGVTLYDHRAYALGWWSALWRTVFLLNFAFIVALAFTILVIALGLAG